MERFSDRIGVTSRPMLGLGQAPYNFRVSLWNVIQPLLFRLVQRKDYAWRPNVQRLYEFLHLPTSQVSYYEQKEIERLEGWLFHKDVEWYEALNFVDFAAQTMWDGRISELAHVNLNEAFEREGSRLTAISRKYSLQLRTRRKLKNYTRRTRRATDFRAHASTS